MVDGNAKEVKLFLFAFGKLSQHLFATSSRYFSAASTPSPPSND